MKYIVPLIAFIVLLGAGCSETEQAKTDSGSPTQKQEIYQGSATAEVKIIPSDTPVIGGTERDKRGDEEQCLINGDCEEGFACIEGKCVQPQI